MPPERAAAMLARRTRAALGGATVGATTVGAARPRRRAAWWTGAFWGRAWAPPRNPLCQFTARLGCSGSARRSLGWTWNVLNRGVSRCPRATVWPALQADRGVAERAQDSADLHVRPFPAARRWHSALIELRRNGVVTGHARPL